MTDASRRTRIPADSVGHVGLTTAAARRFRIGGSGRGSLVELGIAQAALAALLAPAAAFFTSRGVAAEFIVGTAGLMLVVSGVLLVVWSDRDDHARSADGRAVAYDGRQTHATATAGD